MMANESTCHDCAWATTAAVTDTITFLREEERAEFFAATYRACRAMLETFLILANRHDARIAPSNN